MRLEDATRHAQELVALLAPACERIEIAGSIRRKKEDVKDVEIVAIPRAGEPAVTPTPLDRLLATHMKAGRIAFDTTTRRNGPKWKRIVLDPVEGWDELTPIVESYTIAVDLFLATPENYGCILAIRTGCWQFSKWFVTSRSAGGRMPASLMHHDGYLKLRGGAHVISCPDERDFFQQVGVPWYEPEERTPELVERLTGNR